MIRLAPGRLLNAQLRLLSWLGEELYGESFLAELRPQLKRVQVRIMRAEACRTPAYVERFRRTAELALTLRHPAAASVLAFGVLPDQPEPGAGAGRPSSRSSPSLPGYPWLAMDYVEGPDLRSYLVDGLPISVLAALLQPVADVLDRAAMIGLWHGELAPWNLVVGGTLEGGEAERAQGEREPHLILIDLGLAKVVGETPLDVPLNASMLSYRSPEQCVSGEQVDSAADRYALATILYEGVAGRPPFVSTDCHEVLRAHRVAPVPPLRTLVPSLHRAQALDAFFVRALAKQPGARFPSATGMLEEFVVALGLPRAAPVGLPQRRRSPRWYRVRQQGDERRVCHVVIGPRAVLGKQPECDVVCHAMPSPDHDAITAGISREHAVLIWLDDRLSVLDQSVNGTYVNERRASSRLTPAPDGGTLRMGEHLVLSVRLITSASGEAVGAALRRQDPYAAGVPPTLMVWQRMPLQGTPLAEVGGAMTLGQVWVAQRELWWSGHPSVVWHRADGSLVPASGPLRPGDTLDGEGIVLVVEH